MDERGLVAFLFHTLLEEEFGSKTSMAEALEIPFRTIQWIFQHLKTAKGASTAYQKLICYCCEQDIDLSDLFRRFKCKRREEGEMDMGIKRVRRICDGDHWDPTEQGIEKVLEVFDLLLRSVCDMCAYRKENGLQSECVVTRFADILAERHNDLHTKEKAIMVNTDSQERIGIVRWMLVEAFTEYFHGNYSDMAIALHLPETEIKRALESGQWRPSAEVFEKLAAYCLQNGISLDGLLSRYIT